MSVMPASKEAAIKELQFKLDGLQNAMRRIVGAANNDLALTLLRSEADNITNAINAIRDHGIRLDA